jgi:hypothetical protein
MGESRQGQGDDRKNNSVYRLHALTTGRLATHPRRKRTRAKEPIGKISEAQFKPLFHEPASRFGVFVLD